MRTLKRIATAIAAGALLSIGVAAAPAQAGTASTIFNCPDGYVCMYEGYDNWMNDVVEHKYYYYGFNALSNEYGTHYLFNNQTGNARVFLCTSATRSSCYEGPTYLNWDSYNMTPINYLLLTDKNGNW